MTRLEVITKERCPFCRTLCKELDALGVTYTKTIDNSVPVVPVLRNQDTAEIYSRGLPEKSELLELINGLTTIS